MTLQTLFPDVRAQIVRMLFFDPAREFYVRELARESTLALRTVQKELTRLSAIDLVVSRSNGYHRFYRANRPHPAFAALQELAIKDHRQPAFVNRHKRPRASRRRRMGGRDLNSRQQFCRVQISAEEFFSNLTA
jgi:hypothetical protein